MLSFLIGYVESVDNASVNEMLPAALAIGFLFGGVTLIMGTLSMTGVFSTSMLPQPLSAFIGMVDGMQTLLMGSGFALLWGIAGTYVGYAAQVTVADLQESTSQIV